MDTTAKLVLSAKCIIPNAVAVGGVYLVRSVLLFCLLRGCSLFCRPAPPCSVACSGLLRPVRSVFDLLSDRRKLR